MIDSDIKEWKANVIDNLFYDFEAAIIKKYAFLQIHKG